MMNNNIPMGAKTSTTKIAHRTDPEPALADLDEHNTIPFSLAGRIMQAKVLRVIDGDTVVLGCVLFGAGWRASCRCAGYNSPELHAATPEQRAAAIAARTYVIMLLSHKIVNVEFLNRDKYGRELVRIQVPMSFMGDSMPNAANRYTYLDEIMIERGYGTPFMADRMHARDNMCQ